MKIREINRYTVRGVNTEGKKIILKKRCISSALKIIDAMQRFEYTSIVCVKEPNVKTLLLDAFVDHYKCKRTQAWDKINILEKMLGEKGLVIVNILI